MACEEVCRVEKMFLPYFMEEDKTYISFVFILFFIFIFYFYFEENIFPYFSSEAGAFGEAEKSAPAEFEISAWRRFTFTFEQLSLCHFFCV